MVAGEFDASSMVGSAVVRTRGDDDDENFIRGSNGNDRLFGTSDDDDIRGLGGRDRLVGRGGDDDLFGGAGRDILIGGAGEDTFILERRGNDIVRDFRNGIDEFELSGGLRRPGDSRPRRQYFGSCQWSARRRTTGRCGWYHTGADFD